MLPLNLEEKIVKGQIPLYAGKGKLIFEGEPLNVYLTDYLTKVLEHFNYISIEKLVELTNIPKTTIYDTLDKLPNVVRISEKEDKNKPGRPHTYVMIRKDANN